MVQGLRNKLCVSSKEGESVNGIMAEENVLVEEFLLFRGHLQVFVYLLETVHVSQAGARS
jgi:hypothetical protein